MTKEKSWTATAVEMCFFSLKYCREQYILVVNVISKFG
jgi:hypothetical protein